MTLTVKQKDWDATKKRDRDQRSHHRATPTGPHAKRPRHLTGRCACGHGWKHHTAAGRCRPGCACTNGAHR